MEIFTLKSRSKAFGHGSRLSFRLTWNWEHFVTYKVFDFPSGKFQANISTEGTRLGKKSGPQFVLWTESYQNPRKIWIIRVLRIQCRRLKVCSNFLNPTHNVLRMPEELLLFVHVSCRLSFKKRKGRRNIVRERDRENEIVERRKRFKDLVSVFKFS